MYSSGVVPAPQRIFFAEVSCAAAPNTKCVEELRPILMAFRENPDFVLADRQIFGEGDNRSASGKPTATSSKVASLAMDPHLSFDPFDDRKGGFCRIP